MLRRLQKILCTVLIVMLIVTMLCPAYAKTLKAKVSSGSARFYSKASAASASVRIKKGTTLTVTAVHNGWAKVKYKGIVGYMKTSSLITAKAAARVLKSRVVKMDWYKGGSDVLEKDHYAYIYDIASGYTIRIKRMGGHNHADVEPATKADTAKLRALGYSWDSRAVILISNGKYVAAAINTKPHGDQTIHNNGYNGQFCLHLLNSKTHESGKINTEHQAAIRRAYNWAH